MTIDQEKFGNDWVVQPVDGYGDPETIRSIMRTYRPDVLWFMTDPRFYPWLWNMENEVRVHVPMVYYHVWDNYPYPDFNRRWYTSNDTIATISKVTSDIVQKVAPEVDEVYLPHAVDRSNFSQRKKFNLLGKNYWRSFLKMRENLCSFGTIEMRDEN